MKYQRIRKALFLASLALFFFLLPAILLFTFGFKVDWKNLHILKTGLIWINSSPEGAQVYLNGKFLDKKTPATIDELLPGRYHVSLVMEDFYPWQSDVDVWQGKVVSIPDIMLFLRLPELDKLNSEEADNFFIFNHDKNFLYYVIKDAKAIHKVNIDSGKLEAVFRADIFPAKIENLSLSSDKKKLICNDSHNIAIIYLSKETAENNFNLYSQDNIRQVFWHSDSQHFIVVSDRDIKVYELFSESRGNAVVITKLSDKNLPVYYDEQSDTLFFIDQQQAPNGKSYENIYKVVIGPKFSFPFLKGFKPNKNERR